MTKDNIFDTEYIDNSDETTSIKKKSEVKSFLKEVVNEKEMSRYGTSKPKRIIIKAKITNG